MLFKTNMILLDQITLILGYTDIVKKICLPKLMNITEFIEILNHLLLIDIGMDVVALILMVIL